MIRKSANELVAWLFVSFVLMACVLPSLVASRSSPLLQSPVPGLLDTVIAQTVAAAQTETVIFLPSLTSTSTPIPSPSKTQEIPTFTPTFIFALPTIAQLDFTSSPQAQAQSPFGTLSDRDQRATNYPKIPLEWDCRILEKNPPKGTVIKQNSSYYLSWTIINNGTQTWTNNTVDFIYTGGFRHKGRRIQDLPGSVAPGHNITLKVLVTAPKAPGTYNVFWSLKVGNQLFCHMYNAFEVN